MSCTIYTASSYPGPTTSRTNLSVVDSAGDIWCVSLDTQTDSLAMYKLTDKDAITWEEQGATTRPVVKYDTSTQESNGAPNDDFSITIDSGDIIHVVWAIGGVTGASVAYITFNTSTPAWGTIEWIVDGSGDAILRPANGNPVDIACRGTTEVFVCWSQSDGSNYRAYYAKRASGSWGSPTELDAGNTGVNLYTPSCATGDSSRIHFGWLDSTSALFRYATLNSSDSLSTPKSIAGYSPLGKKHSGITVTFDGEANSSVIFFDAKYYNIYADRLAIIVIPSTSDDPDAVLNTPVVGAFTASFVTPWGGGFMIAGGGLIGQASSVFIASEWTSQHLRHDLCYHTGSTASDPLMDFSDRMMVWENSAGDLIMFGSDKYMNLGPVRKKAELAAIARSRASHPDTIDGDLFQENADVALTSHTSTEGNTWSDGTFDDWLSTPVVQGGDGKLRLR